MPRILSIFNFKKMPLAFLLAVLVVAGLEWSAHKHFPQKYFNHEVDGVLHAIESKQYDASYLLLGDSVGCQLCAQFKGDKRFAVMATNQAVEISGQYFIVRRYLDKNKAPKAVIFIAGPSFYNCDLDQIFTENFVLRTFTRFDEIYDLFTVKPNPAFALKMLTYKLFSTFKYRLKLQDEIVGFTNSNIYTGVDAESKKIEPNKYSLLMFLDKKISKKRSRSAAVHFDDLLGFLDKKKINFYYLPVPVMIQKKLNKSKAYRDHKYLTTKFLPPFVKKYSHFTFFSEQPKYNKQYFRDGIHFNNKGIIPASTYLKDKLVEILGEDISKPIKAENPHRWWSDSEINLYISNNEIVAHEIKFGDLYRLHIMTLNHLEGKIKIEFWWEALRDDDKSEKRKIFFHFIDSDAKIRSQQYVTLDGCNPSSQECRWRYGAVEFDPSIDTEISALAFGVWHPDRKVGLLKADKGVRDWNDCRVIIRLNVGRPVK